MAGNQGLPNFQGAHIGTYIAGNKQDRSVGPHASHVIMGDHGTMNVGKQDTKVKQVGKKDVYKMKNIPRGHCLIINNKNFENEAIPKRKGAEHDADNLEETFEGLHFSVTIEDNCKADDIKQKVKKYSAENHKDFDCFVCCILSHGNSKGICGTDGIPVSVEDIVKDFRKCETLVGKPKLFFIQACRGGEQDSGIMPQADHELPTGHSHESDHSKLSPVPETADFLVAYATPPGYTAWRDVKNGSWFISALCDVLQERATDHDLLEMLTEVASRLSEKVCPQEKVQCCQTETSLRKKLYFNPSRP